MRKQKHRKVLKLAKDDTAYIDFSIAYGFLGDSNGKESAWNVGHLGLIPRLGRSPREGNDNPRQYSCLENSKDRGAWQATVHGVAKIRTQLSD